MKKLVLFGAGKITEVIYYYAVNECGFDVAGFCVDDEYLSDNTFLGKPLVSTSEVNNAFPPSSHDMFVAVGYHDLNALRKIKCQEMKALGYDLISIVSPKTNLPINVRYGENCFIMPPAIIHPCVTLGNDVFIWSGAMVGHHSRIEDHCWLTSNCSIGGNVEMGAETFVAMNAVVSHSIKIGKRCFLGGNTMITKHLEEHQVVIAESSKPIRLNSSQFLRMSSFSSL